MKVTHLLHPRQTGPRIDTVQFVLHIADNVDRGPGKLLRKAAGERRQAEPREIGTCPLARRP
jgi:hypothetical protein